MAASEAGAAGAASAAPTAEQLELMAAQLGFSLDELRVFLAEHGAGSLSRMAVSRPPRVSGGPGSAHGPSGS